MRIFSTVILIILHTALFAQHLSGNLKYHKNQSIKLMGFNAYKTISLANSTIDSVGNFTLNYNNYNGLAYVQIDAKDRMLLILNEANIKIEGTHLQQVDSVKILNSIENDIFIKYGTEHNQRESVLSAWKYLLPEYKTVSQLKTETKTIKLINNEIARLEKNDSIFLYSIDTNTYVSWFLPLRKLVDDMPSTAQHYPERIPMNINSFRKINFNDKRMLSSGILDDIIQGHYLLLENMGQASDSMYKQMNISTDYITSNLQNNNDLLNETVNFLFNFLEQRSLFKASEYLATKMLKENYNRLTSNLIERLEIYGVMKVGNIAEDIVFNNNTKNIDITKIKTLSQLNSQYTLVVFGASWCEMCKKEIPKLKNFYSKWKKNNMNVVFVSLDTDEQSFNSFVKDFEWISTCDYKSWESNNVKNYHVFGTPSMFLLNKDLKILVRPVSLNQVDAWLKIKTPKVEND